MDKSGVVWLTENFTDEEREEFKRSFERHQAEKRKAEIQPFVDAFTKALSGVKEKPSGRELPDYPPGDPRWLKGQKSVNRKFAAGFLGIKVDSVRKLLATGQLEHDGKHNVTTQSLRDYWQSTRAARKAAQKR
jgi:hypothetical protein